eukprot:4714845-Alexandrium_andersonii.AAC.1
MSGARASTDAWPDVGGIATVCSGEPVAPASEWLSVDDIAAAATVGSGNNRAGTVLAVQHCARMRYRKLQKRKASLAPHVRERIDLSNRAALRPGHLIDVNEKRRVPIKGRGRYKQFTGNTLIRVCFGLRLFIHSGFSASRKRLTGKGGKRGHSQLQNDPSNPTAAATRTVASSLGSSHAYIQRCRNAMAAYILQHEREFCKQSSGRVAHEVIQLAIDETENYLLTNGEFG